MTITLHDIHNYYEELEIKGESRHIVGNEATRLAISLIFPIRDQSVMVRGEAGSAKTTIIDGMVQLVWGPEALDDQVRQVFVVAGSSDKGLLSGDVVHRINNEATHCIIPELENVIGQPHVEDMLKRWLEHRVYTYSRAADFGESTDNIVVKPLPVITALANENQRIKDNDLGEEMERRFVTFFTESSRDMNGKVHSSKATAEACPDEVLYKGGMAKMREIREHFDAIHHWKMDNLWQIKVKNPCAPFMASHVPKRFTISNTYIGYWHESVKAVADWNFRERPMWGEEGRRFILATPADNFVAWTIVGKGIVYSSLRLKDMGDVLMDALPTLHPSEEGHGSAEFAEVYDYVVDRGYERSQKQIKALLMQLVMAGYAKTMENTRDMRFYKTKDYSGEMSLAISWDKLIEGTKKQMIDNFPKMAKDYIAQFCLDPVVKHPITGQHIKLLDLVSEEEQRTTSRKKVNISSFEGIECSA